MILHYAKKNEEYINNLLCSLPADKEIILYGAVEDAKSNLNYWVEDSRFSAICDRDTNKQQCGSMGYKVMSPDELMSHRDASIVLSTHRGAREIRHFLVENGFADNQIYDMSPFMFYADEEQYFNTGLLEFGENEIFIDAGSKDLGTAFQMKKHCKSLKKVYAFEPDEANYKECLNNIKKLDIEAVEVFPDGTWSEKKTLYFNATADGSSHVCNSGECCINVLPIDEVIKKDDKVTFLKKDVEGSELESLIGARGVITRDMPKLAICIYHKDEDMTEIPLYIKSLVPEYKLYVRHHSNGAGETVLYATL